MDSWAASNALLVTWLLDDYDNYQPVFTLQTLYILLMVFQYSVSGKVSQSLFDFPPRSVLYKACNSRQSTERLSRPCHIFTGRRNKPFKSISQSFRLKRKLQSHEKKQKTWSTAKHIHRDALQKLWGQGRIGNR